MHRMLLLVLLASALGWARAAASVPPAVVSAAWTIPEPTGGKAWLVYHREELLRTLRAGGIGGRAVIETRLRQWKEASAHLARTGGRTDPERGFIIYPPRTTLALFLLDRAERMYAAALERGDEDSIPAVDELFRLAGQELEITTPAKYPSPARAGACLSGVAVPSGALRGYRVFLLPFALGETSGQGGPGYTFVAAEPEGQLLIENQLEVTLIHELGHHLHLAGMPRATVMGQRLWRDYLRVRGLSWREDGPVKTASWACSPEETFAEDFRLLFGGRAARGEPPATRAGDPRSDPVLAGKVRRFMTDLAATTLVPPDASVPWPEGEESGLPGRNPRGRTWMLLPVLPGFALLGLAALKRKGTVHRP